MSLVATFRNQTCSNTLAHCGTIIESSEVDRVDFLLQGECDRSADLLGQHDRNNDRRAEGAGRALTYW